jgi:hypothetical protein
MQRPVIPFGRRTKVATAAISRLTWKYLADLYSRSTSTLGRRLGDFFTGQTKTPERLRRSGIIAQLIDADFPMNLPVILLCFAILGVGGDQFPA